MIAATDTPPVDVALRDGSTARVRRAREDDAGAVEAFLRSLSDESRWLRFMGAGTDLKAAAHAAVHDGYGLVVTAGEQRTIVGHALFVSERPRRAEIAFAVADAWHERGIATILLAHLTQAAQAAGIDTFVASVAPANHRMLQVFRDSGFPLAVRAEPGVLQFEMPAKLGDEARARFAARERITAVAAVGHVLAPTSIAVIGASRHRGTVAGELVPNLVDGGFSGTIHPINPHAQSVAGLPAHPSMRDLPEPVELALVAVPAAAVLGVARDCADNGVRALVVLSAGFAESGPDGVARQDELRELCRARGMRLVGPNCLGVLNNDPAVALNATFAPGHPSPGRVGFVSQSGAFGIAAIDAARHRGLGLSAFVSTGNKADLSGNDFLHWFEEDAATDVIALYLESFGNPRAFSAIARRLARRKPIVAVKSGRTAAGQRAASSHTGALLQSSDAAIDALFAQAGVIRTDTMGELFDVTELLSMQPLPRGDRVAIVTNAGGPGIVCADACVAAGLRVDPLDEPARRRLAAALPAAAAVTNPVDMLAAAPPAAFRETVLTLLDEPSVDALIVVHIPPLAGRQTPAVAAELAAAAAAARTAGKPLLAVFMAPDAPPEHAGTGLPVYAAPEEAARALGHAVRHAAWTRAPADPPATVAADADRAAAVLAQALAGGGGWLSPEAVDELLDAYGIALTRALFAASATEAGRHAKRIGGPVALKARAPGLVHKTDAGAVRLGMSGAAATRAAARDMRRSLAGDGHRVEGFVVQAMAPVGVEMLVGAVTDPQLGAVVACGAGGVTAELLGDVRVGLAPLGARETAEMVRRLRTFALLDGFRGSPRADVGALEDVLARVSALAAAHPEVAELDCNPVIVSPAGAVVVDARVRVERPPARRPYPALPR